eukprot:jgi/Chlat1/3300/Chrsp22S08813
MDRPVLRRRCPQDCSWSRAVSRVQLQLWSTHVVPGVDSWNICPRGSCAIGNTTSDICWFESAVVFEAEETLYTATIYLADNTWDLCLYTGPAALVKGFVAFSPMIPPEVAAIAESYGADFELIASESSSSNQAPIKDSAGRVTVDSELNSSPTTDYRRIYTSLTPNTSTTSPAPKLFPLGQFGFCTWIADEIDHHKACRSVQAMFLVCPLGSSNVTAAVVVEGTTPADIYERCMERKAYNAYVEGLNRVNETYPGLNPWEIIGLLRGLSIMDDFQSRWPAPTGSSLTNYDTDYWSNFTALAARVIPCIHLYGKPEIGRCGEACPKDYLSDGFCDEACNNPECEYDAGDCVAQPCFNDEPWMANTTGYCCNPWSKGVGPPSRSYPFTTSLKTRQAANLSVDADIFNAAIRNNVFPPDAMPSKYRTIGANRFYEDLPDQLCLSSNTSLDPFGADSVFLPGFTLYRPDMDVKDYYKTSEFVTYNSQLGVFANVRAWFTVTPGGSIDVTTDIQSLRVQMYANGGDWFRLVLEVIVLVGVVYSAISEGKDARRAYKASGAVLAHWESLWNFVDLLSIALLVLAAGMWGGRFPGPAYALTFGHGVNLAVSGFPPRALLLANDGSGLDQLQEMYAAINQLSDWLAAYIFVNGLSIMFMVMRVIKLMDFHARVGLLTRTILKALQELLHFFFLASIIFVGYAFVAYLAFGTVLDNFSSYWRSLLGRVEINDQLQRFNGYQLALAILFFWSYIIDTRQEATMHEEMVAMFLDFWKKLINFRSYVSDNRMLRFMRRWMRLRDPEKVDKDVAANGGIPEPKQDDVLVVAGHELRRNELKGSLMIIT